MDVSLLGGGSRRSEVALTWRAPTAAVREKLLQ